jgi:Methyl-accepting chemotaxis protein (MCP) signaling domain.
MTGVVLAALSINLAAYLFVMAKSAGLQDLKVRTLALNADISKFRYLAGEPVSSGNLEAAYGAWSKFVPAIEQIGANISSIRARIEEMSGRLGSGSEASAAIGRGVAALDDRLAEQSAALSRSSGLADGMRESASMAQENAGRQAAEAIRLEELAVAELEQLEQTNILAMNAAIEAAHAGESGAKFKGIETLTRASRASMQSTQEFVRGLSESAVGMAADLGRAAGNSTEIKNRIGEIETGSRDTGTAMQHLRDVTWKISSSVKEIHESVSDYKTASSA